MHVRGRGCSYGDDGMKASEILSKEDWDFVISETEAGGSYFEDEYLGIADNVQQLFRLLTVLCRESWALHFDAKAEIKQIILREVVSNYQEVGQHVLKFAHAQRTLIRLKSLRIALTETKKVVPKPAKAEKPQKTSVKKTETPKINIPTTQKVTQVLTGKPSVSLNALLASVNKEYDDKLDKGYLRTLVDKMKKDGEILERDGKLYPMKKLAAGEGAPNVISIQDKVRVAP